MKSIHLLYAFLISTLPFQSLVAGEGMWIPLLLKSLNEAEMQQMGMKMSAEDIYSVNKGSLKDAIVHFGGFCTAEIISNQGLLLTNHHCGYRQIQSHTTLENNYLKNGFWAASPKEELPNPGLTATLISRIEDVSDMVLNGVTDKMDEQERQSTIDKNIDALKKNTPKEDYEKLVVRPFYQGNQYFLFVTVVYRDVRLVGNPPDAIGKFGADTDNWVWPRHTGDFSLFRIYAGKDNLPADYSEDNVPYQPKHHLPISLDGVKEGDFTLVFGFPGRTNQYLPSYAMEQIVDVLNPIKIGIRDKALDVIDAAMRSDEQIRIQYASKQAGIANAWKKWQGESLGIKTTKGLDRKQKVEAEFIERLKKDPAMQEKYGDLLNEFRRLYKSIEPFAKVRDYHNEIVQRNIELMRLASQVRRLNKAFDNNGEEGFKKRATRLATGLEGFYKNYQAAVDQKVFAALMKIYGEEVNAAYIPDLFREELRAAGKDYNELAERVYSNTVLTDAEKFKAILEMPAKEALEKLNQDKAYQLWEALTKQYEEKAELPYISFKDEIARLQRVYMKALMEAFPDRRFYPDANSTLRVTYGQVKGYQPRDAVNFNSSTYLSGVMEKYQP
ncbi:MAG: S46 family peptidase, partial [Bacteroidota bacterium]